LALAIFFLSPIAVTLFINLVSTKGPELRRCIKQQIPLVLAILLAALVTIVPAAKICAGPRHALPLIPICTFALGSLLSWPRREIAGPRWFKSVALAGVTAFMVIGVCTTFAGMPRLCASALSDDEIGRAATVEIAQVCQRYPASTIGMGYGGKEKYPWTFYWPILAFRGEPCFLDAVGIMEMRASGLPIAEATYGALANGRIKVWLIPAGDEPFSMPTFYPDGRPLFDERFRDIFRTHYQRRDHTAHFDVWVYRGP
jgi:hypothetical protein